MLQLIKSLTHTHTHIILLSLKSNTLSLSLFLCPAAELADIRFPKHLTAERHTAHTAQAVGGAAHRQWRHAGDTHTDSTKDIIHHPPLVRHILIQHNHHPQQQCHHRQPSDDDHVGAQAQSKR